MAALYHNEDCTNFHYHCDTTGGRGGAAVDAYVDVLAGAGVSDVLCNTNAQLVNYRSDAWQAFWEGYDPEGPDDQPYLAGFGDEEKSVPLTRWRQLVGHMLALHREGVDYPARFIARCRHCGMTPWVSIRMNDVHQSENAAHPIHSGFWRDNPQLWRQGFEGYFATAFDFAHAQVRDYYGALIRETLERYDIDGLELDFLREPYLFSRGQAEAGGEILTDWMAEVRGWVAARAEQRGRPIRVGVRVPAHYEAGRAMGIDAVEWARQGYVDLVVAAPRWSTIDFHLPIPQWRRLLEPYDVTLAGGLEILLGSHPTGPKRPVTAAEARGVAAHVLAGGADAVYLFNYFQHTDPDRVPDRWPDGRYAETLRSLASLEAVAPKPRRHAVTFVDVTGPEDQPLYEAPLPAEGTDLTLEVATGPAPPPTAACDLSLQVSGPAATASPAPVVALNGAGELALMPEGGGGDEGRPSEGEVEEGARRYRYHVPAEVLNAGAANVVRLSSADGGPLRIVALSIGICPR